MVRWAVLGLSQDGACTDFFENFSENSLKGDLSNDTTVTPPLFSLVNTFKVKKYRRNSNCRDFFQILIYPSLIRFFKPREHLWEQQEVFSTTLKKFSVNRTFVSESEKHFSSALKEALNNLEIRVHTGLQRRTNMKQLSAAKNVGENYI